MAREIKLGRGSLVAVVDDADYEWLSKLRWRAERGGGDPYAINTKGTWPNLTTTRMHRLIMDAPVDLIVDHINGDTLDNRRANLRLCTHAENMRNKRCKPGRFKGVEVRAGRYRARIVIDRRSVTAGSFSTAEEAARAYDAKAIELHGDFARLNFPHEKEAAR